MSCKVYNCRFSFSHTTIGHKCGVCGVYGHGEGECNSDDKKTKLTKYFKDKLDEDNQCSFNSCKYKWSHSTIAHHCSKCGENHESKDCYIMSLPEVQSRYYHILVNHSTMFPFSQYMNGKNNIRININVGMGCLIIIRKKNNDIQCIFMHSDDWGQYGPQTDLTPRYEKFIEGLEDISIETNELITIGPDFWPDPITGIYPPITQQKDIIECPLCRTKNNITEILDIKGNTAECSICYTNNVEKYFGKCQHACVCNDCFNKL
jgi:hypothetical protein